MPSSHCYGKGYERNEPYNVALASWDDDRYAAVNAAWAHCALTDSTFAKHKRADVDLTATVLSRCLFSDTSAPALQNRVTFSKYVGNEIALLHAEQDHTGRILSYSIVKVNASLLGLFMWATN